MTGRTKQVGAVLCLMAMAFFAAWPFWKWVSVRGASQQLRERTRAIVDKNPQLQPAWAVAMQDDVLTPGEAKVIVEAGGETIQPGE